MKASSHLLAYLPNLADALINPHRTEGTEGHVVKRKTRTGYAYDYLVKDAPNSVGLSRVDLRDLRELGHILKRISRGDSARLLFRQNERAKPSKAGEHQLHALAYWSVRALKPAATDARALRKARSLFPSRSLSDATIRKIAQRYRDWAVNMLRMGEHTKDLRVDTGIVPRRVVYES
jgi:hypothetical protein